MTPEPLLDGELVRRRRVELHLSARALGARIGVTGTVVALLEKGANHPDLTMRTVAKLADALTLDVATLIAQPEPTDPQDDSDDPATLGALLHASGVLTPIASLGEITGWDRSRVNLALEELDARLRTTGQRVHHNNFSVSIQRSVEAAPHELVRDAVRKHTLRDGFSRSEAQLLWRIAQNRLPRGLSNADSVALGVLANAGLIESGEATSPTSEQPWVLAEDVRYSLMLK